jgi:hypothetical protein
MSKRLNRLVNNYDKLIKKLENKLKRLSNLEARNKVITELNTYLRLSGSKTQYRLETQEAINLREYERSQKA